MTNIPPIKTMLTTLGLLAVGTYAKGSPGGEGNTLTKHEDKLDKVLPTDQKPNIGMYEVLQQTSGISTSRKTRQSNALAKSKITEQQIPQDETPETPETQEAPETQEPQEEGTTVITGYPGLGKCGNTLKESSIHLSKGAKNLYEDSNTCQSEIQAEHTYKTLDGKLHTMKMSFDYGIQVTQSKKSGAIEAGGILLSSPSSNHRSRPDPISDSDIAEVLTEAKDLVQEMIHLSLQEPCTSEDKLNAPKGKNTPPVDPTSFTSESISFLFNKILIYLDGKKGVPRCLLKNLKTICNKIDNLECGTGGINWGMIIPLAVSGTLICAACCAIIVFVAYKRS